MNITRENTGELTATVRIDITEEDYNEKVTKVLKDYQRKANIPGFRPGKVPFGLVRKMYGKAAVADEINKLVSDSLARYIQDEKLEILGNPIPNRNKNTSVDFDSQSDFAFYFDLGFAPEIDFTLSDKISVERYKIMVDDEMVERYVTSIRKRYGTPVKNEQTDDPEEARKAEIPVEPAELNKELFDKVYPGLDLLTEEDFREQVRKDASGSFTGETDKLFYRQVIDKLVKETPIALPEEFLRRWLYENNDGKYSQDEINKQFDSFADSMRWQLLENKIMTDHKIEIKDEDIRNYIRGYFMQQIPFDQDDPETDKRYNSLVDTIMKNKEQVRKINDELYTNRLLDLFKSTLTIEEKEIPYERFITLASEKHIPDHNHEHEHEHDHDHDHDHDHNHEHNH